ncbi:MAG: hypothetical protein KGL39_42820 [Patescibacteria group bacterium]|nr:hypothetical protein [Patescibacteria group bacterium]
MTPKLTPAIVRELLDYDPDSGFLMWRKRSAKWFDGNKGRANRWNARYAGKLAFSSNRPDAKLRGTVAGVNVAADVVAWMHYYDEVPKGTIMHLDGCVYHDALSNLKLSRIGGGKGVYKLASGKWRAMASVDGVWRHLGCYDSEREAKDARAALDVL